MVDKRMDMTLAEKILVRLENIDTRLEGVESDVGSIALRLQSMEGREAAHAAIDIGRARSQENIERSVESLLEHKNKIVGAFLAIGGLSAILGAAVATLWDAIAHWVKTSR